MINLPAIAAYLEENNMWDVNFRSMDEFQIKDFAYAVMMASEHKAIPYIEDETLYLPPNVHPDFKYWQGGQSIKETLEQINAPHEMIEKYCPKKDDDGLER